MRAVCIQLKYLLGALALTAALLHCAVAGAATVPQAASAIGREMDRQIMERLGQGVSLCFTTPADVNNLERSNALARQMQEEIARWFVQAGYDVQEIRKGADVLFEPEQGELLLTRKQRLLGSRKVATRAIVGGTYTVTAKSVRFNIRVVATGSREILAMSTMTVPMSSEIAALLKVAGGKDAAGGYGGIPIEPTVVTLLP